MTHPDCAMQDLMRAIRRACSEAAWSTGVEFARTGAVVGVSDDDDEVELQVITKGGLATFEVVLYLEDAEWTCTCRSPTPGCPHVAGAAIALKQARAEGLALPEAGDAAPGRLGYRLERHPRGLSLRRVVVPNEGTEHELTCSLTDVAAGHYSGPGFAMTSADHKVEAALVGFRGGRVPPPMLRGLFEALADVGDVTLDGTPVRCTASTTGMRLVLTDGPEGSVVATLEQDPLVDGVMEGGIVVRGDTIAMIADPGLEPKQLKALRKGRRFRAHELGTLVGQILPALRRRFAVVVRTEALPETGRSRPWVRVVTDPDPEGVALLPTLVYGRPPVARVDGSRIHVLRDDAPVPVRDAKLEEKIVERFRKATGLAVGQRIVMRSDEAIAMAAKIEGAGEDCALAGARAKDLHRISHLGAQLNFGDDDFQLSFVGEGGGAADPRAVVDAFMRADAYVPLIDGGFGRVPSDWLAQHGHHLTALIAAGPSRQSFDRMSAYAQRDLAALCEAMEEPPPAELGGLAELLERKDGIEAAELPEDLRAELRPYQRAGIDWLCFLREARLGALLADDMGLGKTLQALCAFEGRTLVVAPTSVLHNWAKEAEKFRPGLGVSVYHGPKRKLDPDADVTLTTYALLRIDADLLHKEAWGTVVLDEAQTIKNPDSQVAQAAFGLQATFRIALTGTPVENRLEDLWSQFHFINPGLLGGRSDFDRQWSTPIASGNAGVAERLRARIKPFLLRRKKSEVAKELPSRTDVVLHCELDESERAVYDAVRAATEQDVLSQLGGGTNVMALLEALLRLRQASCHRGLVPGQDLPLDASSSKLELLAESLSQAVEEGHKALVFSQWTSLLDRVEPMLNASKLDFCRLDGSTTDRGGVVDRFQADDGPPVMLLSLRAGGTGLNLTAADHVFLLDPWWNPAVEDQAADRAHRIGQTRPVIVHRLVARDTVEERILELQQRKRALADAAIGDASSASAITREELLGLLR